MLRPRQLLATSIQRRQIATSAPRVPVLRIYAQRCASSAASAAPALSDSAPSLELVPPSSSLSSTSIESVLTFEPTELTSQFGESHSRFVAAPKLSRIASPNSSTPSERSAQAVDNSTTTTTITSTSPDANTATYPAPGQDPYTIPFEAESSPPTPVTAEEFLYLLTKICPNNIVPYRIGVSPPMSSNCPALPL
ncbi:hypothetical protein BDZ91DRAFT_721824 [Kalaharituber pfeilii]|nr:hypothetical protein BDZ91DRAFT_721824 [Kalaharituber pfeilii]